MTPSPMVKLAKEESIVSRETQHRSYLPNMDTSGVVFGENY